MSDAREPFPLPLRGTKPAGDEMIYNGKHGYSISSHHMWLPGLYDSEATARYAFQFPDTVLQSLSDRICRIDGENRKITKADLQSALNLPDVKS